MCIKLEQLGGLFHQLGLKDPLQDMDMDQGKLAPLRTSASIDSASYAFTTPASSIAAGMGTCGDTGWLYDRQRCYLQ
jgi:hypothetical protein